MEIKKKIQKGIYLVVDPSMEETILLTRIEQALQEQIVALQIWDNFQAEQKVLSLIDKICEICHSRDIPVFINNRWELLGEVPLDGVHFDEIPEDIGSIRHKIGKQFLSGLTCNNDLSRVRWANYNQFDYISFCSIFPSNTSNSCELVELETIKKTKEISSLPVFLAGGINPENIKEFSELDFEGVAVISGIMNTNRPQEAIQNYLKKLNL